MSKAKLSRTWSRTTSQVKKSYGDWIEKRKKEGKPIPKRNARKFNDCE